MTLKSLLIISIAFSLVLIASTLYIAENTPRRSSTDVLNSTIQNSVRNDPEPPSLSAFAPINKAQQSNEDIQEPGATNLSENKPLMTVVINSVLEKLYPTEIMVVTNNAFDEQDSQSNSPSSTLNQVVNNPNGMNFNELLDTAPLTDSQLSTIKEYSGGMNPMELVDQFCGEVRSGEFHNMTEDIRRSYNYNPASPAILMSIFEKMGDLCP